MKHKVYFYLVFFACLTLVAGLLTNCTPGGAAGVSEPEVIPADTPTAEPVMAEPTAVIPGGPLAYVQNNNLYISTIGDEPLTVDTCPTDAYCILRYLKWSPDGQHLLYYFYDGTSDSLRIADLQGQVQVVAEDIRYVMPGDWSPDGQAIVYLRPTDTHLEGTETTPPIHVHEVWTAALDAAGMVQEPQLVGSTNRMEDGCGGGGRSISEVLYENEGGTAYGYLMSIMEWTPSGTLLMTNNCTNIGIDRFDMTSGTDLPPFDMTLSNLVLDDSGTHWYARTGRQTNEIATGTPEATAVTIIPTTNPVELVFYGSVSHKLYYTTREFVESTEISDIGAYFQFYKADLWQINVDGSEEKMLWQTDDQALAQMSELPNGDILLVRVESDRPLYEALQNGTATMDDMGEFAPQRHIVRLINGSELQPVVENAGQPEIVR